MERDFTLVDQVAAIAASYAGHIPNPKSMCAPGLPYQGGGSSAKALKKKRGRLAADDEDWLAEVASVWSCTTTAFGNPKAEGEGSKQEDDAWEPPSVGWRDAWKSSPSLVDESVIRVSGKLVLLPPASRLYWGDACAGLLQCVSAGAAYTAIVMDPPWECKSVSRGSVYRTTPLVALEAALVSMPVQSVVSPAGAVAVWVTNNPAVHTMVLLKLFPAWGLRHITTVVWLKITTTGVPVLPTCSPHRRPTELAFIGVPTAVVDTDGVRNHCKPALPVLSPRGLSALGLVSVVSADVPCVCIVCPPIGHSVKPPLDGVLEGWMAGERLEVYARNLRRGWSSIGMEVLAHQTIPQHFIPTPSRASACTLAADGESSGGSPAPAPVNTGGPTAT